MGYDAYHFVHNAELMPHLPTVSNGSAYSWDEYIHALRQAEVDRDGDGVVDKPLCVKMACEQTVFVFSVIATSIFQVYNTPIVLLTPIGPHNDCSANTHGSDLYPVQTFLQTQLDAQVHSPAESFMFDPISLDLHVDSPAFLEALRCVTHGRTGHAAAAAAAAARCACESPHTSTSIWQNL